MLKHYALSHVIAMWGSVRLGGYNSEGSLTIAPRSQVAEAVKTGDGSLTIVNHMNDDDGLLTVEVSERAPQYKLIGDMLNAQLVAVRTPGMPIPAPPFEFKDTISGEGGFSAQTAFLERPEISKGTKAGMRKFTAILPGFFDPTFQHAPGNLIPGQ